MLPPFTESELLMALRVLLDDDREARSRAAELFAVIESQRELLAFGPRVPDPDDERGVTLGGMNLSLDLLVVLSLLSEELERRVVEYRFASSLGLEPDELWESRRQQLAPLVRAKSVKSTGQ